MTEALPPSNPSFTTPNPLTQTAPELELGSHVPAQPETEVTGGGADEVTPTVPYRHTNGAVEPTGSVNTNGTGKAQRSRPRSKRRLEELQRRQAALVKPEKKTEAIPGTRLEPALHARWESAVKESGLSSSRLVYVAVVEYLEAVEQRSILAQMQGVARLVADTGKTLLSSMEEVRARLEGLDSMTAQLKEAVALQEAKFVTADDVEAMLVRILHGAEEEEPGADELEP